MFLQKKGSREQQIFRGWGDIKNAENDKNISIPVQSTNLKQHEINQLTCCDTVFTEQPILASKTVKKILGDNPKI